MGNFISNLIARHTTAASYVMPRHRGRFEPQPGAPAEAMPAYFRADASPSADNTPAAASARPERAEGTPASAPLHEAHMQQKQYKPAVPPANRTVAPPETLLSLFTPPATEPPAASPSSNSVQEHALPGNYPDPVPIPGTVNNLFANHPPPVSREANTPPLPPEQEQHTAARPLYFTVSPPGQQGTAFTVNTVNNGKASTVSPYWENHFSPDRNTQRSALYSNAASAPQPVIKVSIGRIDVRAVTQSAAAKQGSAAKPAMSLDDFLKKRSGGTS